MLIESDIDWFGDSVMSNVEFISREISSEYFTGEFGEIILGILRNPYVQSCINDAKWQDLLDYLETEDRYSDYGGVKSTICEILLKSGINILDGLTAITDNFLYDVPDLKSIHIPNTCKRIGRHAFDSCEELTDVYIPRSVTAIDGYAFSECSKDLQIHYAGTTAEWSRITFGEHIFDDKVTIRCTDGIAT